MLCDKIENKGNIQNFTKAGLYVYVLLNMRQVKTAGYWGSSLRFYWPRRTTSILTLHSVIINIIIIIINSIFQSNPKLNLN